MSNKQQKEFFNKTGDKWLNNVMENNFYTIWLFNHLPSVEGEVLEIGAGRFSYLLSKLPKVNLTIGDISETMLKSIKLKVNKKQLDIEMLPYEDNSFDYIVAFGILHHINDQEKALSECYRVAKKGVYIIGEPNPLYLPLTLKIILCRDKAEYGILKLPVSKYKKILSWLGYNYKIDLKDLGNHKMSENFFKITSKFENFFKPFLMHINIFIKK